MIELTLEMAEKVAKAGIAKGREMGATMAVSVVDESGRLVYFARDDGAHFFTADTSRGKAVTAAAFKRTTKDLMESQKDPVTGHYSPFWNSLPALLGGQVVLGVGGAPIIKDGRTIGAVGCGGGKADQDHQCSVAAARAVSDAP